MIRNLVIEIEATETAIGKVELDFLAQLPLRTNSIAVSDDEHPDHEAGHGVGHDYRRLAHGH
jgi:hypothetical protein